MVVLKKLRTIDFITPGRLPLRLQIFYTIIQKEIYSVIKSVQYILTTLASKLRQTVDCSKSET